MNRNKTQKVSVNRCKGKQVKKILLETLKITCGEVNLQQSFFKDLFFSPSTFKTFCENSRTLTEKSTAVSDTCQKFMAVFCEIVIIFLKQTKH